MDYMNLRRLLLLLMLSLVGGFSTQGRASGLDAWQGAEVLGGTSTSADQVTLIPMPRQVRWIDSEGYKWGSPDAVGYVINLPNELTPIAHELMADLAVVGKKVSLRSDENRQSGEGAAFLTFNQNQKLVPTEYRLSVSADSGVLVEYCTVEGARYALQTLRQLITPDGIPAVEIVDRPRFCYRGLMLDVSRHFMPKEFVLKLLDEMARYKLNRFHWHLTDGGGWRLEIKAFPQLTQQTAYRTEADFMKWWESGDRQHAPEGTPNSFGGYYTQDDVREVVAYAHERGIEVIPEIEMPSHSSEVLYALPQLSCTGEPERHERDFCLGNTDTYSFLYRVLDEVIDLFPSRQIHIGGDEADKEGWKTCPKCVALMNEKGLNDVDQLQTYFLAQINDYVRAKGRSVIGWDDISAGGTPEEATIMSWRGEEGGIEAARSGHDAIMCPVGILYFDYYQSDRRYEPLANGWMTTFMRTYSYDPVPAVLTESEQKRIIGVQGNLWTEYVPTSEHAEYMIFPRLLSLAEIAWTVPERKDPDDFRKRVNREVPKLRARGVNSYAPSSILLETMWVNNEDRTISVTLNSERDPAEIRYTIDGTAPSNTSRAYHRGDTIVVTDSAQIVAAHFVNGAIDGHLNKIDADYHRGIGKPLTWMTPMSDRYASVGLETALVDGRRGTYDFSDGIWLGTNLAQDNIAVVDMQETTRIGRVSTRCMHQPGPGLHMPEWVELSLSSDGVTYHVVGRVYSKTPPDETKQSIETFSFLPGREARYIRLHYHLPQAGQYLMTDEIVIW